MARITRLMLSANINGWAPPEALTCLLLGVVVVITMVSMTVLSCVGHGGGDKKKIRSRWGEVRSVYVRGGGTKQKKQIRNGHRDAWFLAGGVAAGAVMADTTLLVAEAASDGCGGGYSGGGGGGGCGGGCGSGC